MEAMVGEGLLRCLAIESRREMGTEEEDEEEEEAG
jgi:hypothetical protein